ncbi:MAG: HAD family hydrolase [Bacteroidaceae bacterium]|nr:HAD family hydrolase [Bacteroidaceae bacterium]
MLRHHIPQPPAAGPFGYWLKRGDAAAQSEGDVLFAPDESTLQRHLDHFRQRGIADYVVSAHVPGDVVKFYGVRGSGFFRTYYPTDDGDTKYSHEQHNGPAHHYPFDALQLEADANRLAAAVGVEVYGGDVIVRSDGTYCFIDFNDWPSFSRCRDEAAVAIADRILFLLNKREVKGYIFDYGGTLDSGGNHWGKVFWKAYQRVGVPVSWSQLREAYVYAERYLGKNPVVQPDYTFHRILEVKLRLQLEYLSELSSPQSSLLSYHAPLLAHLYDGVCRHTAHSREVLSQLEGPKVVVSNFYGNLPTVLREFHLDDLFSAVVESAVVGVRKPDPQIFALGVEALGLRPHETVVVGDSIDKDLTPARAIGCRTAWIKGEAWNDEPVSGQVADVVITDLEELKSECPFRK